MNRKLFLLALAILTTFTTADLATIQADEATNAGAALLAGNVVIVGDSEDAQKTSKAKPLDITPGGLIVIQIDDQGSAPVDIKKYDSKAFEYLGEVRGVRVSNSEPLMGGGYKWVLFKAGEQEGPAEISVTFKSAPHAGGKTKTATNYFTIVANEE